ncbi:hypothetical protein GQ473_03245 [archaeon]|nr:hypothetical protein [archaeon]
MKKSKSFIQYSEDSFSIRLKIGVNGNVFEKGAINYCGKKYRNNITQWVNNNKEHRDKISKEWRENNPKKMQQCHKDWVKNNKLYVRKYAIQWSIKNKDKIKNYRIKHNTKRNSWGEPEPLNDWFIGSCLHHTHRNGNHKETIFIPKELHTSNRHSYKNKKSMNKINKLAFEWLETQ